MIKYFKHLICEANYKKKICFLQNKKTPINVIFLVTENQKWGFQSLYDLLDKDPNFKPLILVGVHIDIHKKKDSTKFNLQENYDFFKAKGMNVDYLYQNGNYRKLRDFKPDMVFYEQQWGLPKNLRPEAISKYALTFFAGYGFPVLDYEDDYMPKFHSFLFKYFTANAALSKRFDSYHKNNSKNCEPTGCSKLDTYLDNDKIELNKYWKSPEACKIIYSPHHSVGNEFLKMSTFETTGKLILELAKNTPNTSWIFKPHPRLKFSLIKNNLMTSEEVENYYKEWETIGSVYDQGSYFDIFKSSDLMITDCCSFLAEYLPSGKPLIRLINEKSASLNPVGEEVVKGYYQVSTVEELKDAFEKVVILRQDPKKEIRFQSQKYVIDFNQKCCVKIYNKLCKYSNRNNQGV